MKLKGRGAIPSTDIAHKSRGAEAEDALCVMHLHAACKRVGVRPLSREGFSVLYLGEYAEIRERFHPRVCQGEEGRAQLEANQGLTRRLSQGKILSFPAFVTTLSF